MTEPLKVHLMLFSDVSQTWNRARLIPRDFADLCLQGKVVVVPMFAMDLVRFPMEYPLHFPLKLVIEACGAFRGHR